MNSLNRGIKLIAPEKDIKKYVNGWWEEVKLYELKPA
jgi:hypothetical protein